MVLETVGWSRKQGRDTKRGQSTVDGVRVRVFAALGALMMMAGCQSQEPGRVVMDQAGVVLMTGTGGTYAFEPGSITAGREGEVLFQNVSDAPHNVVIEELGVESEFVKAGGSWVLALPESANGSYTYVCTLHPGMEGRITSGGEP